MSLLCRSCVAGWLVIAWGCQREVRNVQQAAPASAPVETVQIGRLQPGQPGPAIWTDTEYTENAAAMSEGKTLFSQYNCVGCHAHGGGGMGVPLIDDVWIYGSDPANLFATIAQGRPNGMPAFGRKIPRNQIWKLAAYVRSMSGQVTSDAAPGRDEQLYPREPEQMMPGKVKAKD